MIMPQSHRSAFAKFRSGVASLRIETAKWTCSIINAKTFILEGMKVFALMIEHVHFAKTVLKMNFMFCLGAHFIMSLR